MAERRDDRKPPEDDDDHPARPERPDARTRFARAMARAAFGRFYWSAEQEKALHKAMKRKRRKP